jgi:hypothetical protein
MTSDNLQPEEMLVSFHDIQVLDQQEDNQSIESEYIEPPGPAPDCDCQNSEECDESCAYYRWYEHFDAWCSQGIFDEKEEEDWDEYGFSRSGFHKDTNDRYDPEGFTEEGVNVLGYCRKGFNIFGDLNHKDTGTKYNPQGLDMFGFDVDECHDETGIWLDPRGETLTEARHDWFKYR